MLWCCNLSQSFHVFLLRRSWRKNLDLIFLLSNFRRAPGLRSGSLVVNYFANCHLMSLSDHIASKFSGLLADDSLLYNYRFDKYIQQQSLIKLEKNSLQPNVSLLYCHSAGSTNANTVYYLWIPACMSI